MRLYASLCLPFLLSLTCGDSARLLAQPVNDDCANATIISLGQSMLSTVDATTDGPDLTGGCDPGPTGDEQIYNDVWFSFTAIATEKILVRSCNLVTFDTRISIHPGGVCPPLAANTIACNDDAPGCGNFTSALNFDAVAGETYLVRVGGFDILTWGSGNLELLAASPEDCSNGIDDDLDGWVDCDDTACALVAPCIEVDCSNGLDDDGNGDIDCLDFNCAGTSACPLPANDDCSNATPIGDGLVTFLTTGASNTGLDIGCIDDAGISRDVWHAYTATCTGDLTIDWADSCFDTTGAVYEGSCGALVEIDCDTDFYGPLGGACAAYTSRVTIPCVQGTTYFIRTGGLDGEHGAASMMVSCAPVGGEICDNFTDDDGDLLIDCNDPDCLGNPACPVGEACLDPLLLSEGDNPFSTIGAVTNGDTIDPAVCDLGTAGDDQISRDLFGLFVPSTSGNFAVSTCGLADFDTRLAVYESTLCPLDSALVVACDDDGSRSASPCAGFTSYLEFSAVAGIAYLVRVGGFDEGEVGTGTLRISKVALPPTLSECRNASEGSASIVWDLPPGQATYDSIEVRVDGVLEATLAPNASTYTTLPGTVPANREVCVSGVVGGVATAAACCTIGVFDRSCEAGTEFLTHNLDPLTVVDETAIVCANNGIHTESSYWRVFDLTSFGFTVPMAIASVEIGIQRAIPGPFLATQPIEVRLHEAPAGTTTPAGAALTTIGSTTLEIPVVHLDTICANFPTNPLVDPTAVLVVEVFLPDGTADEHSFRIGANSAGQTGPTFLSANTCSLPTPADTGPLGFPDFHALISVNAFDPTAETFLRGDCNSDGSRDISDPIFLLDHLFTGGSSPSCFDACDSNDEGLVNIADVILTLDALFTGGGPLPDPYDQCGADPTGDTLTCPSSGCP